MKTKQKKSENAIKYENLPDKPLTPGSAAWYEHKRDPKGRFLNTDGGLMYETYRNRSDILSSTLTPFRMPLWIVLFGFILWPIGLWLGYEYIQSMWIKSLVLIFLTILVSYIFYKYCVDEANYWHQNHE